MIMHFPSRPPPHLHGLLKLFTIALQASYMSIHGVGGSVVTYYIPQPVYRLVS